METVMATESNDTAKQLHDELLPNMPQGSHDPNGCRFCSGTGPRETAAAGGAGMAGESTAPPAIDLNAPEIVAVVNDRVTRETAELRTRAETAEQARDAAQTKIDVLEAEKSAAEQAKAVAEKALADSQAAMENEKASASRRDTRKAALREVAAHLTDEWFAAEVPHGEEKVARLDKIARMGDAEFDGYKAELASAFEGVTVAPAAGGATTSQGSPPRETAMAGASNGGGGAQQSPSSKFLGGVSAYGPTRVR